MRKDQRGQEEIRKCTIITDYMETAYGSCLIAMGKTKVICTASVEEKVPSFLRGKGQGWLTAEYAMLPASTGQRKQRDGIKKDGRSVEIQRLIGRSLRQAIDLNLLGERTIYIDCDVLQADGGTRTAAITGAFIALVCAVDKLMVGGKLKVSPIISQVAAISAGIVKQKPLVDLCYEEDSQAQVDMNVIMNEKGEYIELQGTGEGRSFTKNEWHQLNTMAEKAIEKLMALQVEALGGRSRHIFPRPALVIASENNHKIREIGAILAPYFHVISMSEAGFTGHIEEDGNSFSENAALKARAVAMQTGMMALGDDSGIEVEALNGAPGIHSARYAGEHGNDLKNNQLLLKNMENEENRNAQFVCALALANPQTNETLVVEGLCKGRLLKAPVGFQGFGYDPLFQYEDGRNFGEMYAEEKNAVSHRAKALEKLIEVLEGEQACIH